MSLNECNPSVAVCRCCAQPFTADNPASQTNVNMCCTCVYTALFSTPPSEEEAKSFPNGRWNQHAQAVKSQQDVYDAMLKEIKKQ